MRVAVTGTPGTGKTTATALLAEREGFDHQVVHLNDLVREYDLVESTDAERDSLVVDLDAVRAHLATAYDDDADLLVESHLAHLLPTDRVVVLRAHPVTVRERLVDRGESEASATENAASAEPPPALARKARENAESEALDVILSAAVDRHGADAVHEVDTTDRDPTAVADAIAAVVAGERDPAVGVVEFSDYLVGEGAPGFAPMESGPDADGGGDGG
ncbi:adenylate kinase [Haloglomus irregulare]|jgi:adenylate kinase|uniref:Putative adenylate kinase n=1 Tax=Haloglomus irregulare TaxID=2234134 RepID=A0A554N7C3_9EURY|nr:AAA family ATPase [Haloglomus irregulare]TSD13301.1 adenylate kinase [Haloglomus irregulare]